MSARRPDGPKRAEALWLLTAPLDRSRPLEDHIESLVQYIEARSVAFTTAAETADIDVSMSISRGDLDVPVETGGFIVRSCGVILEADLLARISALHLALMVDIY